jgi:glutamyl-tRNA synthetase/glutamyl-Q tRNA(Asp) synthetase
MKTRFAPSLTGYLHLGHVLHMIYVWGIARAQGAEVVCRIEDHDLGRARPEYEAAILENMQWLGFVPDSDGLFDFRQSESSTHYESVLQTMKARELVYGCECSRKAILENQTDGQGELCYPGTCAEKDLPLEGNTVRFRISHDAVAFNDLLLGECHQAPVGQCGDFSLRDRNGQWAYQFACVCDDLRQEVDLVIRGEDILSSTGRQILLFRALGHEPPRFCHHPLLYDAGGEKLSKRQRSESITQMREDSATAEEILGRAAFSGNLINAYQPLTAEQAMHNLLKQNNN